MGPLSRVRASTPITEVRVIIIIKTTKMDRDHGASILLIIILKTKINSGSSRPNRIKQSQSRTILSDWLLRCNGRLKRAQIKREKSIISMKGPWLTLILDEI